MCVFSLSIKSTKKIEQEANNAQMTHFTTGCERRYIDAEWDGFDLGFELLCQRTASSQVEIWFALKQVCIVGKLRFGNMHWIGYNFIIFKRT